MDSDASTQSGGSRASDSDSDDGGPQPASVMKVPEDLVVNEQPTSSSFSSSNNNILNNNQNETNRTPIAVRELRDQNKEKEIQQPTTTASSSSSSNSKQAPKKYFLHKIVKNLTNDLIASCSLTVPEESTFVGGITTLAISANETIDK